MSKPSDKVQLIKQESAAGGGDPADVDPFYLESPLDPTEDAPEVRGIYLQPSVSGTLDEEVYITRDGQDLIFRDETVGVERTLNDLTGGGLNKNQHDALRSLIHFIDQGPAEQFASGAFKEVLPEGSFFPTSEVWWESSNKQNKIVETNINYSGVLPSQVEWKVYDTDGSTVLATIVDSINYQGVVEVSRTRTIS